MVSSELAHRLHSRSADVSWIDVTTAGSGQPAERIAACLTTVHGRTGPHLLVLDGVSDPDDVVRCLPRDETRVLITSRADTGVWHRIAHVVQVPVLPHEESVRLLRKRVHGLTEADAMHLAGALDDLPLAMENAASWLTSGMTPGQVLEQLKCLQPTGSVACRHRRRYATGRRGSLARHKRGRAPERARPRTHALH